MTGKKERLGLVALYTILYEKNTVRNICLKKEQHLTGNAKP